MKEKQRETVSNNNDLANGLLYLLCINHDYSFSFTNTKKAIKTSMFLVPEQIINNTNHWVNLIEEGNNYVKETIGLQYDYDNYSREKKSLIIDGLISVLIHNKCDVTLAEVKNMKKLIHTPMFKVIRITNRQTNVVYDKEDIKNYGRKLSNLYNCLKDVEVISKEVLLGYSALIK